MALEILNKYIERFWIEKVPNQKIKKIKVYCYGSIIRVEKGSKIRQRKRYEIVWMIPQDYFWTSLVLS